MSWLQIQDSAGSMEAREKRYLYKAVLLKTVAADRVCWFDRNYCYHKMEPALLVSWAKIMIAAISCLMFGGPFKKILGNISSESKVVL